MKIEAIGTTKKGSPSYTVIDHELFFKQLEQVKGQIKITIEPISEAATERQQYRLNALINDFRNLAEIDGNLISDNEAEAYILGEICKMKRTSVEALTKEEISKCIDITKLFIEQTF